MLLDEMRKNGYGGYEGDEDMLYLEGHEFLQNDILGHCCCGLPKESLEYIRKVLQALHDIHENDKEWDTLNNLFHSIGEQYTVYYMLHKYRLTEHGGTVAGWLTERGKELLTMLNELNANEPLMD